MALAGTTQYDHMPVHDRLYSSITGLTKAERKALTEAWRPPAAQSVADMQKELGKKATVTQVAGHGLRIVEYPPGRQNEQKKDPELTHPSKCRRPDGGFYSS